jgi:hypothetical protein
MPKSAIINIERENQLQETPLKKMALFFDSLYVNERNFYLSKMDIERSRTLDNTEKQAALSEIDWLVEKGIIKLYDFTRDDLSTVHLDEALLNDAQQVDEKVKERFIPAEESISNKSQEDGFRFAGVVELTNDLIFRMEDIRVRVAAAVLGKKNPDHDFVPIVNSFASYQQKTVPSQAVHFILGQLPVPQQDTPWEQIIDFREDDTLKRQYYALLNWLNQVSNKDMPVSHIIDEYNHLYSEYTRQYALHKMNSRFTTIELLITSGIELLSSLAQQGYVSAIKDVLTIRKKQVALLKEEKDIEGRELAYIFSAQQSFK